MINGKVSPQLMHNDSLRIRQSDIFVQNWEHETKIGLFCLTYLYRIVSKVSSHKLREDNTNLMHIIFMLPIRLSDKRAVGLAVGSPQYPIIVVKVDYLKRSFGWDCKTVVPCHIMVWDDKNTSLLTDRKRRTKHIFCCPSPEIK